MEALHSLARQHVLIVAPGDALQNDDHDGHEMVDMTVVITKDIITEFKNFAYIRKISNFKKLKRFHIVHRRSLESKLALMH